MNKKIMTKIKDGLGWMGALVFAFWALCLLAVGNPISAVITLGLAFLISPLRKKVFGKYNLVLKGKKLAFTVGFFFLSSCGTFLGLTEVEDTSTESYAQAESAETESLCEEQAETLSIMMEAASKESIDDDNKKTVVEMTESEVESEDSTSDTCEEKFSKANTLNSESIETQATNENEDDFQDTNSQDSMQVHFIDVGQGDATLVTCGEEAMLIDAGDNSKGTTVQLYLKKQGISELKYLILTHPDADHIGGADVVVTKFDIDTVFMSDFTKDNKTYNELISALDYKGMVWSSPNVGNTYTLGSAEFTIIAPNTTYSEPNNASIGLLLVNGENSFLFTGDAEEDAEYDILANGLDIDCDVYKAGHHGSKTASTKALLEAASPEYVVVSCAADNSYGHPHAEPMNNFRSMGMKLFRTDEQGSIIATADGKEITWNSAPSESWKAGENTQATSTAKTSVSVQGEELSGKEKGAVSQTESQSNSQAVVVQESASELQVITESESQQPPEQQAITEPEPTPAPVTDIMVWKTKSGKKYHSINNCGNTDSSKATQITKTQAEAMGLGPCSKCW